MTADNNYGFGPEWKVSEEDPGYMVKTIVVGNVTCDILRPILDPKERAKREEQLMDDIAKVLAPHIRSGRIRDEENEGTA